jgi:hypothetical protein
MESSTMRWQAQKAKTLEKKQSGGKEENVDQRRSVVKSFTCWCPRNALLLVHWHALGGANGKGAGDNFARAVTSALFQNRDGAR